MQEIEDFALIRWAQNRRRLKWVAALGLANLLVAVFTGSIINFICVFIGADTLLRMARIARMQEGTIASTQDMKQRMMAIVEVANRRTV